MSGVEISPCSDDAGVAAVVDGWAGWLGSLAAAVCARMQWRLGGGRTGRDDAEGLEAGQTPTLRPRTSDKLHLHKYEIGEARFTNTQKGQIELRS